MMSDTFGPNIFYEAEVHSLSTLYFLTFKLDANDSEAKA